MAYFSITFLSAIHVLVWYENLSYFFAENHRLEAPLCLRSGPDLLRVISNKYVNVYMYMSHTITCSSTFEVVYLSHRYVLSYVNILNYLPGSYYMERLIIAKVAVDRSVLMSNLFRIYLSLPGTLATTNDCFYVS